MTATAKQTGWILVVKSKANVTLGYVSTDTARQALCYSTPYELKKRSSLEVSEVVFEGSALVAYLAKTPVGAEHVKRMVEQAFDVVVTLRDAEMLMTVTFPKTQAVRKRCRTTPKN